MPLIGIIMQGQNFADLSFGLGEAQVKYGLFIQAVVDFAIIAFALFLVVKAINAAQNKVVKKEEKVGEPTAPVLTTDQELLTEIRDLLKKAK